MTIGWQDALVLAVVAAAAGYVLLRVWRAIRGRKSASCGGCGTCSSTQATAGLPRPKTLVQIDPPQRS
jgi:hypothetical protein